MHKIKKRIQYYYKMKLTCLLLTRIALRFWVGWEFEFGKFGEAAGALFVADDVDGVEDEAFDGAFSLIKIKNTKMKNMIKKYKRIRRRNEKCEYFGSEGGGE